VGKKIMGKELVSNRDRTLECAVCGKQFNRGHLDLARHMNAVTLQHLFAKQQSEQFSFGCKICGIYFTCQEHLDAHNTQTTCGKTKGTKAIKSFIEDLQIPLLKGRTMPANSISPSTKENPSLHKTLKRSPGSQVSATEEGNDVDKFEEEDQEADKNDTTVESPLETADERGESGFEESKGHHSRSSTLSSEPQQEQLSPIPKDFPEEIHELVLKIEPPLAHDFSLQMDESSTHFDDLQAMNEIKANIAQIIDPSIDPHYQFPLSPVGMLPDGSIPPLLLQQKRNEQHYGKTMECMVCGKLFPRGPIDLQRHATGNVIIKFFIFCLF
jgi:transcription elongation factor Elf1